MSSIRKLRKSTTSRRSFLKGAAAVSAAAGASSIGMPFVHAAKTIKIGVVLPFSGGLEIYAEQDIHGVEMAVKEANEAGGVLGRQIELIITDGKTDPKTVVERAIQLIQRDEVTAVMGPVMSASRNAVQPTMERYKTPLLYATDYEGGVCSRYMFCYSQVPDHYVEPLMPYLMENYGDTFYMFGADYVWPRQINAAVKKTLAKIGGKVVGEEYTPFGVKDFSATLRKIEAAAPAVYVDTLPGGDGLTFIKQFHALGLKDKIRFVKMDLNENYLHGLTNAQSDGMVGCAHFIQTLDRPEARDFVARQLALFGEDTRVTYLAEAAYGITKFFIEGIRRADSDDKEKIIDATVKQELVIGNGPVFLREEDHHVDLAMLIHEAEGGKLWFRKDIGSVSPRNQCTV